MKKKIFSLLALLMTAVTGVWAESVVYALQKDDVFTSGQTVEVKNTANDVVATITFGESGGADFKAAKADTHVTGFSAFTEGNGVNGNKTGGTFYTITPKVNATINVAVVLNADKEFYILEDGTALTGFDGMTVSEKKYGTFEFTATANKAYKVYCAGSKLGFYGFEITPAAAGGTPSSEVTPVGDGNLLIGRTEHGTVAFKVGGNVVTDAEAGDNVNVVVTPDEGWSVGSVKGQWWAVVATSRRIGASGTIDLEKDFEIEAVTGTENTFAFEMKLAKVVVSVDYRKLLTNTDISVDNIASVTYTGEELKPAVTVMDGETVLVEGTDYTVDYTDNVNVGTATATITGIGKYDGEVVTTFDIDKTSSVVIAPTPCTLIYNGKVQTLINAGAAGGGVLQYSRDGANYSPELPQGLNAGIYTIFYKVFGDSNHNDSEPERMRVIIAPKSIDNVTVTVSQPSGSAVPTVTAKEGKVTLVEEEDYEISYKDLSGNNVTKEYVESNFGDYIAVITFIGNYSGTVEQQFTVQTTTAIIALSDSPAETAPVWYTLDGRKISTPTKQGVYIRNGKKVVVK